MLRHLVESNGSLSRFGHAIRILLAFSSSMRTRSSCVLIDRFSSGTESRSIALKILSIAYGPVPNKTIPRGVNELAFVSIGRFKIASFAANDNTRSEV